MLFLAKAAGVAILVWFYVTARNNAEPPIKWAVIGLMGYWIAWWAVKLTVVSALAGMVAKSATGTFLLLQVPAIIAVAAAFLIRKKLLADAKKSSEQ